MNDKSIKHDAMFPSFVKYLIEKQKLIKTV